MAVPSMTIGLQGVTPGWVTQLSEAPHRKNRRLRLF